MTRLPGGLVLATMLVLLAVAIGRPDDVEGVIDHMSAVGVAELQVALRILALIACAIAILILAVVHLRYRRLVRAAERMAAGQLDVLVPVRGAGLEGRLAVAVNRIAATMAETHDRATIDKLTGVANRQTLITALWNEVERAHRYDRGLSVAFVDIDHFKSVNDTYGHTAGDAVLRGVAQAVAGNLRASDTIGRYGGEEFMLILTETDVEEAAALAEQLRTMIERQTFAVDGNPDLSVTISIGIAGGSGASLAVDTLVRDADAAMYSAKSLGRNQTYIFAEPEEGARIPRAPISAEGRARAQEVGRLAREAAEAALTSVLAPRERHQGRPSSAVPAIVARMAERLDLPEAEGERLRIASLFYDIGKLAVADEIIDKPRALGPTEWQEVVQHSRIGQVILEQASMLRDAAPIILHHHERFAGRGYPFGLRGTEIPLGARIVAIADAYDAMTTDRPQKTRLTHEAAITEIRRQSGTQFDPELVAVFCELFEERPPTAARSEAVAASGRPSRRRRVVTRRVAAGVELTADPEIAPPESMAG